MCLSICDSRISKKTELKEKDACIIFRFKLGKNTTTSVAAELLNSMMVTALPS
jgi:hypothetical protein